MFLILKSMWILFIMHQHITHTLPKTNIAPETRSAQKDMNLPTIDFQGRAVSFWEGTFLKKLQSLAQKNMKE